MEQLHGQVTVYVSRKVLERMVGATGIEPVTPAV
jgi:hypothetical protein